MDIDIIKTNKVGLDALLFHWIASYYNMKALAEKQITLKEVYGDMHELNMGTLIEEHPFQIKRALRDAQDFALDILTHY